MAKTRRASDPWKSRLFKTSNQSDLTELHDRGFDKESQMHKLIERNIGTLFPGLKLLETEFREMARGELRPDTIAFDTTLDTFVALEYKNRLNKEAVDQARTYLSSMRQHQGDLVLSHSNNMKCRPRDQKSFKWKKMYAIIMAPEFGGYQVSGAKEDPDVELYEISMHDDRIMLVERVSGAHERTVVMASAPGPDAEATQTQTTPHAPRPDAISTQTGQLYNTIRARLLRAFPGAEETEKKFYNGFRYPGDKYFCTISPQKSKIWLAYSGKRAASELRPDDFVRNVDGWGVGKLRSEIKNEADFEKALAILKRLHAGDSGGAPRPAAPSRQANKRRVFSEEMIRRALQSPHDNTFYTAALTVRLPITDGDRAMLTFGGLDDEGRFHVTQQVDIPDSFSYVAAAVEEVQNSVTPASGNVTVQVDTTGRGASLWDFLLKGGIRDCWGFKRKDGSMDAAYDHLRAELAEGRVLLQDPDSSHMDELCGQLRGIVRSDDGTIKETEGSDRAASLAIAVLGAKQTGG